MMKQQTTAEMPIRPSQASPIGRSTQYGAGSLILPRERAQDR